MIFCSVCFTSVGRGRLPYTDRHGHRGDAQAAHISDYVRGFSMDEIEHERDYKEWEQSDKPECVNPTKCPRGMRRSARAVAS